MKNNKKSLLMVLATMSMLAVSCSNEPTTSSQESESSETKKTYFQVSLATGEGYTVTPSEGYNSNKVEEGKAFKFVVSPKEGYAIRSVKIEGKDGILLPDDDNVYTISSVTENLSIKIEVEIKTLSVVFSGEHFSIQAVEGYQRDNIAYGSSFRFKITPDAHYSLTSVTLDGVDLSKDANDVYTVSDIKKKKTVKVSTKEDTYKLKVVDNEFASIQFEEADLNLNEIGYFSDVKFKVNPIKYYNVTSVKLGEKALTPEEDGYYHIKNQTGEVSLSVVAEILRCQVSFSSGCSLTYDPVTVDAGTRLTSLPSPSRAEDEYYGSYSFEGWYSSEGKFDISKPIEKSMTLCAKWKQNDAKKTIVNEFKKEEFIVGGTGALETLDTATSSMAYDSNKGAVDADKKAQLKANVTFDENDGVLFDPKGKTGTCTLPKINFTSLLNEGNEIQMIVGGYNRSNVLILNEKRVSYNKYDAAGTDEGMPQMVRTLLTFFKGNDSKIHVTYEDRLVEKVIAEAARFGELTLTDAQANGTEGLTFSTNQGGRRHYWISKPWMVKAERNWKDFSKKTGVSVTNATLKAQSEYNSWSVPVLAASKGVGILGTSESANNRSILSFDKINFSSLFKQSEGIRFSLGTLEVEKEIGWKVGDNYISLGKNSSVGVDSKEQTAATIQNSWKNWVFDISSSGVFVYNQNEKKEYVFSLTEKQISGEEKIELDLSFGKASTSVFFLLTNMKSYKA